jgi:hypothetical protein
VKARQHPPMATLRFFAENLPADVVGQIIHEKPDAAANRGEVILSKKSGRARTAKLGTWFITTEHRRLGYRPEQHLAWVVRLAIDHFDHLKRLIPGIGADLSLLVHDPGFDPRTLPRDLLKQAVEIGEVEIEIPPRHEDIILNADNLASVLAGKSVRHR